MRDRLERTIGWLLIAGLAGCGETGLVDQVDGKVRLVLAVSEAFAGEQIEMLPYYLRGNQSRVDLPSTQVAIGTSGTQQVPLDLELTGCLEDGNREAGGSGCPLRLTVVLKTANGTTIDSETIGPIDLIPGQTATTPAVTLQRLGSLSLRPTRDTLDRTDTTTVVLTVKDRQGGDLGTKPATWATDPAAIASVSSSGLVTALSPGVATVRAALIADPTVTGTVAVAVRGVVSLAIAPDSVILSLPGTANPGVTVTTVGVSTAARWRSGSPAVATVDATLGTITAISPGRAVIAAEAVADTSIRDSVAAVVSGIAGVAIAPDTAIVELGKTTQLVTTVSAYGGVPATVSYGSSVPAVATVSGSGLVTAVGLGTTVVRAAATADPTKSDSVLVRVFSSAANTACTGATFLTTTIQAPVRLLRTQSPYRVPVGLRVDGALLTIDPGVTVCFDGGVALTLANGGRLSARGTAVDSIHLTASNPVQPWGGIRFLDQPPDSSYLTSAVVELGALAPMTVWTSRHSVVFDSVRFRRWSGAAVALQRGRLSRSVVDTTLGGNAAVYLGQGVRFENTTVRQAPNIGVYAADSVVLIGGRIEGTDTGLVNLPGSLPLRLVQPVRITGNRRVPASLEPDWVAKLGPDSLSQTFLLGNAVNAVVTEGTLSSGTIRVFGHLGLVTSGLSVGTGAVLVARPGAQISIVPSFLFDTNGFILFADGGRLDARGTLTRPVRFAGQSSQSPFDAMIFMGTTSGAPFVPVPGDTSRLINVLVENGGNSVAALRISTDGLPVVIDSSRIRQAVTAIHVAFTRAPGFTPDTSSTDRRVLISRTRVDTSGLSAGAAVQLLANSVLQNSVIRGSLGTGLGLFEGVVDGVTVTESAGIGIDIVMLQNVVGPLSVQGSNLVNNGGVGLNNNHSNYPLSVANNWWGDINGPNGSFGDGISGFADPVAWATAPFVLNTPFPISGTASGAARPSATAAPALHLGRPQPSPWPKNWLARHRPGRR